MREPLREALRRLDRGDADGARQVAEDAREDAAREYGEDSVAHALAAADLATVELAVGEPDRAVEARRRAARVAVTDDASARVRSAHLLDLARLLATRGAAEEAERVAGEAIALSQAGATEVARARLALARLRLGRGRDAAELAQQALQGLWGLDGSVEALMVTALAAAQAGRDVAIEPSLDALPDPALDDAVQALLALASEVRPALSAAVALRLATYLQARRSVDDPDAIDLLTASTNLGRVAGEPTLWIEASRALVATLRRANRPGAAALAGLGLAAAATSAGDAGGAEIAYEAAMRDAERADDPSLPSQVLRSFGLFLAGDGRTEAAEPVLRAAIDVAGSGVALGRSLVAYGLVLAHAGRDDEARTALEGASGLLPPDDRDALAAAIHLDALANGHSCGCGSAQGVTGALVRALVLRSAPRGLLDDVVVDWRDGKPHVRLVVLRDPEAGELQAVDSAIRGALARAGSER
jgi:tetratricopeptide (TPR) repeat protein